MIHISVLCLLITDPREVTDLLFVFNEQYEDNDLNFFYWE